MLFLENEAQIDQNNYGTMLFMSKQVSLPKISSILQKKKIGQNSTYALFARSPSIILCEYKNCFKTVLINLGFCSHVHLGKPPALCSSLLIDKTAMGKILIEQIIYCKNTNLDAIFLD